jgi:hypothetical protein
MHAHSACTRGPRLGRDQHARCLTGKPATRRAYDYANVNGYGSQTITIASNHPQQHPAQTRPMSAPSAIGGNPAVAATAKEHGRVLGIRVAKNPGHQRAPRRQSRSAYFAR